MAATRQGRPGSAPAWGASTPQQRFDLLDAAGSEILARKAQLGDQLTREEGNTLPEAIGEVDAVSFTGLVATGQRIAQARVGPAW